jgi:hypothetical protein
VAEAALTENDWTFFREWWWGGVKPGDDPDADRQIAEQSRPGALSAALNWYRASVSPETFHLDRTRLTCLPFRVPPWASGAVATSFSPTGSHRFVKGLGDTSVSKG